MILNKTDLQEYLDCERKLYPNKRCKRWKYVRLLRLSEYHLNQWKNRGGGYHKYLFKIYNHLKNNLGYNLGYEIEPNVFGKGLKIGHSGSLIINGSSHVGEYCTIMGNACLGSRGGSKGPTLGNNCELGQYAVVIGDVKIGDNTYIGAGAVVVSSFPEGNQSLAGVPAKVVRKF